MVEDRVLLARERPEEGDHGLQIAILARLGDVDLQGEHDERVLKHRQVEDAPRREGAAALDVGLREPLPSALAAAVDVGVPKKPSTCSGPSPP